MGWSGKSESQRTRKDAAINVTDLDLGIWTLVDLEQNIYYPKSTRCIYPRNRRYQRILHYLFPSLGTSRAQPQSILLEILLLCRPSSKLTQPLRLVLIFGGIHARSLACSVTS